MLGNLILFAIIAATSLHQGESKKIILNLGSTKKGERRNFNVTCNGPSKQVNSYVKTISGNLDLHLAKQSLPHLGTRTPSNFCNNCVCSAGVYGLVNSCKKVSLGDSRSFGLSVSSYLDSKNVTLMVETLNLDNITEIVFPSLMVNLGLAKEGERRNFNVTCYGPCEQVNVYVRATSGHPELYLSEDSLPHLDVGFRCRNCLCRSTYFSVTNVCQYYTLGKSSSFAISMSAYRDSRNTKLMVEALNVKNITEIIFPSQLLNLGSAKKGDRMYFKVTCNGRCEQVKASVRVLSGNPALYLAENSFPHLDVNSSCNNCFCADRNRKKRTIAICRYFSFGNYGSFGLAVEASTDYENATLMVEARNLKNVTDLSKRNCTCNPKGVNNHLPIQCNDQGICTCREGYGGIKCYEYSESSVDITGVVKRGVLISIYCNGICIIHHLTTSYQQVNDGIGQIDMYGSDKPYVDNGSKVESNGTQFCSGESDSPEWENCILNGSSNGLKEFHIYIKSDGETKEVALEYWVERYLRSTVQKL